MTLNETVHRSGDKASLRSDTASRGLSSRRRKRKLIACLLAAVFPGLGHFYLQLPLQGAALISLFLLDISGLVYFSSIKTGLNVPLLILLGLLIPVIYFYSIYTVLQGTDRLNSGTRPSTGEEDRGRDYDIRQGLLAGLILISGGALMYMLRLNPPWLPSFLNWISGYLVSSIMIVSGAVLTWREIKRRTRRSGRFTASAFLFATGVLLLWDRLTGENLLLQIRGWWPLVVIALGVEHIFIILWSWRSSQRRSFRIRIDIRGIVLSLAAVFSVFAVTQQEQYMHLWNRMSLDLAASAAEFSKEEGFQYPLPSLRVPIDLNTEQIVINGTNGNIDMKRADIDDIRIEGTVWVDELPEDEAAEVAAKTEVASSIGKSLTLTVKNELYGVSGKRHPRVNLTILLPENRFLDLDISTTQGSIRLTRVQAMKQIKLQTGNGNLRLWEIGGDVSAKILNGDAEFYRIFGSLTVDTQSGSMKGNGIDGDVALNTKVGDISLVNAEGAISAGTRNGNIVVDGVPEALKAESLNGKVNISSSSVGGDWNVYSGVGEVLLELPATGSYTLEGSSGYGDIESNLPFPIENKVITGIQGAGEFLIKVEGNSNLIVNNR